MSEKVKVQIRWSEKVSYRSTVEMKKEDYNAFVDKWNENEEEEKDIENFLAKVDRLSDVVDSRDPEIEDFDVLE